MKSLTINGAQHSVDVPDDMILSGSGSSETGRPYMPGFAAAYSDAEIAAVANYVTARFGATPSRLTPDKVAMLRSQH